MSRAEFLIKRFWNGEMAKERRFPLIHWWKVLRLTQRFRQSSQARSHNSARCRNQSEYRIWWILPAHALRKKIIIIIILSLFNSNIYHKNTKILSPKKPFGWVYQYTLLKLVATEPNLIFIFSINTWKHSCCLVAQPYVLFIFLRL